MCVCNNIYILYVYYIYIHTIIQCIMLHLRTDTGKWHVQGLSNKTWMSSCKALWKHLEDKKVKWSSQLSQFSSKHTILHMHCVVSLSALRPKVDATTSPCSLCSGFATSAKHPSDIADIVRLQTCSFKIKHLISCFTKLKFNSSRTNPGAERLNVTEPPVWHQEHAQHTQAFHGEQFK